MSKLPLRICHLPISLWKSKTRGIHMYTAVYHARKGPCKRCVWTHCPYWQYTDLSWWDFSICGGRFVNLSAFRQDPNPDDAFGCICISQRFIYGRVQRRCKGSNPIFNLSVLMLGLLIISTCLLLSFHHNQFFSMVLLRLDSTFTDTQINTHTGIFFP